MDIVEFLNRKKQLKPLTMVTAYDFWSAKIINESLIDAIIVGDSLSMVMLGNPATTHATIDHMVLHIQSVCRGAPQKFIIGDMPFLSYRKDLNSNMVAVDLIMKAGSNAIKLEGVDGNLSLIRHIVQSGVPVMGHIGYTPQLTCGVPSECKTLLEQALKLQEAGCFSILLEFVSETAAKEISDKLKVPIIGLGSGKHVDGQLMMMHRMLGFLNNQDTTLKTYMNGFQLMKNSLDEFCEDVVRKEL